MVLLFVLFSFALLFAASLLAELTALPFVLVLVIGSAIWVYQDAKRIDLEKYPTGLSEPLIAALGCLLVWIVAFPWYLNVRHQIVRGVLAPRGTVLFRGK